jgi:hypothetical protein
MQADKARHNKAEGSRKSVCVPPGLALPYHFRVHSCPFAVGLFVPFCGYSLFLLSSPLRLCVFA